MNKLRAIHQRFFAKEFVFPLDRDGMFSNKFVITDDFNNPITFGMLELSAEAIVLTDKNYPKRDRIEALLKLLQVLEFETKGNNLNSFYCSVTDDSWKNLLLKNGFKNSKGNYLFHKLGE